MALHPKSLKINPWNSGNYIDRAIGSVYIDSAMTNKATNRDFCKRCGVSVTETDYDAGQCTNCGLGLPQKSMSKVSTRLMSLLQKRMPKLVKARASKRNTSKFQMFDVGEIMARHAELIRLAINRGYSVKALTGLVRAAEDAYQLNHA